MEWIRNAIVYSPIEKELLAEDAESPLSQKYGTIIDIDGIKVHVAQVPASNSSKLPKLPPVVCIHGLGGSMHSFLYISRMLNRVCDIVMIDLPGHGKSPDPPAAALADTCSPTGIVELITKVIERTTDSTLPFVLLGHSYGTTHALRISTGRLQQRCLGLVCITPPYGATVPNLEKTVCKYIPVIVFDSLFRARDRRGGLYSPSVNRMVSSRANARARRDQLLVNLQARSRTILATVVESSFFDLAADDKPPNCPVLVISAADDQLCPPKKSTKLCEDLQKSGHSKVSLTNVQHAGHAVMFEKPEIIDNLISEFFGQYLDERLTMAWQLKYLASLDNKWSLKNEKKWRETLGVGEIVSPKLPFKGMKVLRENDENHSPKVLESSHPEIMAVVDISQENPPYNPQSFRRIKYYKFPTTSKIPPSKAEVEGFIQLINKIRTECGTDGVVAVHCHYGFNRTGFFICSYLISECGLSVHEALDAYKKSRPPGIKHQHFISELYARYSN